MKYVRPVERVKTDACANKYVWDFFGGWDSMGNRKFSLPLHHAVDDQCALLMSLEEKERVTQLRFGITERTRVHKYASAYLLWCQEGLSAAVTSRGLSRHRSIFLCFAFTKRGALTSECVCTETVHKTAFVQKHCRGNKSLLFKKGLGKIIICYISFNTESSTTS